ncbi:helix-turn-helix domain-containing protein [Geodermatophilus ruber]|uniref:Purine catabolism regulatory protein n=1 Tax=Geodermatophilus ruber TaxID=504800 RepID=A0A1I4IR65_9ACTN|nr:PucR family transcriptional regulator ligand-binding domain-containing protein [Geodermatophilus ruber]SFL56483.1 purine catabolism regulatory protein [Geodermatophilus ruber]
MLPTVTEVLRLPALRAAAPEVLTGDPDTAVVRWVHSSEVYEMGGLLAGGELLLTTGLGLHGRTAQQVTDYVEQLADAGCAGLALEVGRSFAVVPHELVQTARRRGMVLVTLREVVPFVRMVEDFHDLLLRRKLSWRRPAEPIWQELLGLVLSGQGLAAVLNASARLADCPVELVDVDGRVVERSRTPGLAGSAARTVTEVRGAHGPVGRLVLHGRSTAQRTGVAERAAVAVALELGRHPDLGSRPSLAQAVITDLVAGVLVSQGDLQARLSAAGWVAPAGSSVLVAAVEVDRRTPASEAVPAVREAAEAVLGRCLVGAAGSTVIVLARGWPRSAQPRQREAAEQLRTRLCAGPLGAAVRTIGAADPVSDLADVPEAVARAREVITLSRRIGSRQPVVTAQDVAVHRLLAGGLDGAQLASFVTGQLGPLVDHDAAHGTDLLRTLDAHLATGLSKTRTAESLGIRRQTLYARLERIEHLLGTPVEDPAQRTCLGLALAAWRMRTGLDPQAVPGRSRG